MRKPWLAGIFFVWICRCALPHGAMGYDGGRETSHAEAASEAGDGLPPDVPIDGGQDAPVEIAINDVADVPDAPIMPDVVDVIDAADTVDVPAPDVMDVPDVHFVDAMDVMDAPDAVDAPLVRVTLTVRIDFIHDTIAQTGDYWVRFTYPPGFLDGSVVNWSTGHCVGGVRSLGDPRNTDECTLNVTSFVNGERVDFYPIYASDSSPICSCESGGICPSGYTTYRFTVYLDPSVAVYGVGSGLTYTCELGATSSHVGVMSFTIP